VIATVGIALVTFGGVAPQNEAIGIMRKLSLLAQEKAVPYEAVDGEGIPSGGICDIINLKFEIMNTRPPTVSFSGQLIYPFNR
jgi:hypothetical protein